MKKQMWFDGSTYDPRLDAVRLTRQLYRVWDALNDYRWHTLSELAGRAGGSEAGVSARIRDYRKPRFGGHTIERRRVDGGLWQYRLSPTDIAFRLEG
jgi:hypothetical protein